MLLEEFFSGFSDHANINLMCVSFLLFHLANTTMTVTDVKEIYLDSHRGTTLAAMLHNSSSIEH